jgi:hypothetical protein
MVPLVSDRIDENTTTDRMPTYQMVDKQASETKEWRTRPQLSLLIENIPTHWMVADLKRFLDGFGNVVKAEIFEERLVCF